MEELLLRPHECAEVLGLRRSKGYQLIAGGTIPSIPSIAIGKSRRIPLDAPRARVRARAETGAGARPGPLSRRVS